MLIAQSTIKIDRKTLIAALQLYFDEKVFKSQHRVISVDLDHTNRGYNSPDQYNVVVEPVEEVIDLT